MGVGWGGLGWDGVGWGAVRWCHGGELVYRQWQSLFHDVNLPTYFSVFWNIHIPADLQLSLRTCLSLMFVTYSFVPSGNLLWLQSGQQLGTSPPSTRAHAQ